MNEAVNDFDQVVNDEWDGVETKFIISSDSAKQKTLSSQKNKIQFRQICVNGCKSGRSSTIVKVGGASMIVKADLQRL